MSEASEIFTVPARRGAAARLSQGQAIRIINTHGEQVVDTWCVSADDWCEFMSMEHIRATLGRIFPRTGDSLVTNRRRPILVFEEDTSPGTHDTLMAACDDYRYGLLGCTEYHDNCTDNFYAAMRRVGVNPPDCPSPLNLWMNIPGRAKHPGASPSRSRETSSFCAPAWTASWPCRPVRRIYCRSTGAGARPPRPTIRCWVEVMYPCSL